MGGHDHGHHEPPYKIPDYRIYKVENIPRLVMIQKALAAKGLKDPWLRNEVWRYSEQDWGTQNKRMYTSVFRGFKWGLLAAVITVLGTKGYQKMYPADDHGHGGHH